MIRKLIPLLLALVGIGAGIGAGLALRPVAEQPHDEAKPAEAAEVTPDMLPDYVKLNNQFIVPVLEEGRVASMVILSLSVEVKQDTTEQVYAREPKLRDVFLQVMFDHANAGGFRGSFTDGANLLVLRRALREAAQTTLGAIVTDVLIVDIVRQDS